jgi:hypothetical protein
MLFKHFSLGQLILRMPIRALLDALAAVRFLMKGEWSNSSAVVRAHVEFFYNLGREIGKRRAIQTAYPRYTREGMKSGSIVFDYYVRGKKTFVDRGDQ